MEKRTALQIKVGIFVSLGLFLAMVTIFFLGGKTGIFERHYFLYTRFDNITGLNVGADIALAGIHVGTVDSMNFSNNPKDNKTIVKLKINRDYQSRILEDSRAIISTQGLLGDKMILITVGINGNRVLQNEEYLEIKESVSLESVAEKGDRLLESLQKPVEKIDALLRDIQEKPGLMHALIYELEGKDFVKDMAAITRSGKNMFQKIEKGNGILHDLVYDKENSAMAKNLSSTLENMKNTSQSLSATTKKIEKGEGSIGALINDPTLYHDFKTLLGKANRSKLIQAVIRHTLSKNEKDTLK